MMPGDAGRTRLPAVAPVALCLFLSAFYFAEHSRNRSALRTLANQIVAEAGASDETAKALALRDFLRSRVRIPRTATARPLLRDSALETIRKGQGHCGEVSRAFICLAREVGVKARRINLVGRRPHVVAEAVLSGGERRIVDSQNPPRVEEWDSLDKVLLRDEYDDYVTVNVHRLGLGRIVPSMKIEIGPLTYVLESPSLMQSVLWLAGALSLLALSAARRGFFRRLRAAPQ